MPLLLTRIEVKMVLAPFGLVFLLAKRHFYNKNYFHDVLYCVIAIQEELMVD